MTILIGLAPGERGTAALHLGAMLARSRHDDVVVAAVVPTPWPPNPYRGDAEYLTYVERTTEESLDRARATLADSVPADFVLHRARSVSSGLLEVAREREVALVSLGSSSSGLLGLVSLGGVAERILHSSDISVSLAPSGFTAGATATVERVTVAFGRADHDSELLTRAATTAREIGASMRVACFAVRPMSAAAGGVEASAEDLVVDAWAKNLESDIARTLGPVSDGAVATRVDTVVGSGGSWAEALADVGWSPTEVLVVGVSSSSVSRLFLGSHASKIVRNAGVPVMLLPRGLTLP